MTTTPPRQRGADIVAKPPEATCTGDQHPSLAVRGKKFGYFLDDHHVDDIVGMAPKAGAGEQEALIRADPTRYYAPAYVGANGRGGVRHGVRRVDWAQLREVITDAYRLQVPRCLVALLDG